ncbi:MAG: hypothetical protein LBK94_05255 [Prevotellaceae bacterium]|jgi:hypothetical protein|nr:hypothetical protein [Prevotellaceae bacterium]
MKRTFYVKTDNRNLDIETDGVILHAEIVPAFHNGMEISETIHEEYPLYISIVDCDLKTEISIDVTAKEAAALRDFITDLLKEMEQ